MPYSAHLSQINDRSGLICMASLFSVITIFSILLRFYVRRLTKVGLCADDWLALSATVFVLALDGIFLSGTVQGAITGHSPVVNDWPVSTDLEHLVEKYKYAFQTTEKVAFGLIKLSILFLWKRMFGQVRSFAILCWAMIVIVTAWSISFFFATLFQCGIYWTWNWAPITLFLTQCVNTLDMLTVFTATDVLTDLIILFMPVPIIWGLHMPPRKKIGVTSIFMVGFFTIGAGIARMYIYLVTSYDKADNPDFIADFTLFMTWSEVEANIAMLVCCMPTLSPVVAKVYGSLTDSLRSVLPGKSGLLSLERRGSKEALAENKLLALETLPPPPPAAYSRNPWHESFGTVTAAGYTDLEGQPYYEDGILARTEIHRVSEPKYSHH